MDPLTGRSGHHQASPEPASRAAASGHRGARVTAKPIGGVQSAVIGRLLPGLAALPGASPLLVLHRRARRSPVLEAHARRLRSPINSWDLAPRARYAERLDEARPYRGCAPATSLQRAAVIGAITRNGRTWYHNRVPDEAVRPSNGPRRPTN